MTGAAVHYGDALFELAGAEGCDGRILEELDAVTDEETPLPFGTEVVVTGISGGNTLIVRRK